MMEKAKHLLWGGPSAAQEAVSRACSFPIQFISSHYDLPEPISDVLRKDGLYPDSSSTAGPFFLGSGQYGDHYFVWSTYGCRSSTSYVSLYVLADKVAVRVAQEKDWWPNDIGEWCSRTKGLIDSYSEQLKNSN